MAVRRGARFCHENNISHLAESQEAFDNLADSSKAAPFLDEEQGLLPGQEHRVWGVWIPTAPVQVTPSLVRALASWHKYLAGF